MGTSSALDNLLRMPAVEAATRTAAEAAARRSRKQKKGSSAVRTTKCECMTSAWQNKVSPEYSYKAMKRPVDVKRFMKSQKRPWDESI